MTVVRQLRAAGALVMLNGVIAVRRTPLFLLNTLAAPFSFLFLFTVLSEGRLVNYGVAGGLVLSTFSIGMSLQADLMHFRVDLRFQDMVVASPTRAATYVLGMALSELAFALPGIAVFVAVGVLALHPTGWSLLLLPLVLAMVWAAGSALGFFLATYLRDVRETFAIAPVLSLALSVLPPVYYPATVLPASLRWLALVAPTADAAQLAQGAFGAAPLGADALVAFAVLAAWTVGFLALAAFKARWREV